MPFQSTAQDSDPVEQIAAYRVFAASSAYRQSAPPCCPLCLRYAKSLPVNLQPPEKRGTVLQAAAKWLNPDTCFWTPRKHHANRPVNRSHCFTLHTTAIRLLAFGLRAPLSSILPILQSSVMRGRMLRIDLPKSRATSSAVFGYIMIDT